MFTPLQTIEGLDRIFHPQMISYVDARVLPTVVTFFGGSTMEIDNSTDSNQLYESLKASGAFIEHDVCLFNPADIAQVLFQKKGIDGLERTKVCFANGASRSEFITFQPREFYQKWVEHGRLANAMLARMMQPQRIVAPDNDFQRMKFPTNISKRRN